MLNPYGSLVMRGGTDLVHPMIPFAPLLATALACAEAEDLINGVKRNRDITNEDKLSLVEVIKLNTEECFKDANAD